MSSHYTLAEHSGLGDLALEPYHVAGRSDERAVRAAGGVLLPGYAQADALADVMLRYVGDSICPGGVVGSFSTVRFRGMRLWLPDEWATTVLRLGEECTWSLPLGELADLADAILATPNAGMASPCPARHDAPLRAL